MTSVDYFASQAFAAGNETARLRDKVEALEEALEETEIEIAEWRRMYVRDVVAAGRGQR